MLTRLIMRRMHWDAIWYADRGPRLAGLWHVGTWTGPERDLVCIRRCATNEEARLALSPSSRTLLGAAFLAWRKASKAPRAPGGGE